MSSSGRIPEDLHLEILIRLPVKFVLTSKSVCKSWYSQISNPSFVKLHLQQNKKNSSSSRLLLGAGDGMQSIGYDSLFSSLSTEEIEDSAVRMPHPFRLENQAVMLFGSCNGLVFLWVYDNGGHGRGDSKDFLCAWNPSTREYKKIPKSPITSSFTYYHYLICINGLRYDGKNDDYKFVTGICPDKHELSTLVEVFSLRSNSWETIETPYGFTSDKHWEPGVVVNGDLHWLAKWECGICIVYLDFSKGTPSFKEIQLPEKIPRLNFSTVSVLEEGRLCAVADEVGLGCVEVWEMQVYGVRDSWTKRYVIANETITMSVMVREFGWQIIWSFKNGKILFVDSSKLVIYDPKRESAIERNLAGLANFISDVNYLESLVSINSTGTYARQNN